jgi:hypothetical protein
MNESHEKFAREAKEAGFEVQWWEGRITGPIVHCKGFEAFARLIRTVSVPVGAILPHTRHCELPVDLKGGEYSLYPL